MAMRVLADEQWGELEPLLNEVESMQFRGGDHAAAGRAAPSFAGRKPG